jgi:quercetin dioxygenase-like cupin family protein
MEKWSLAALADGLLKHALSAPSRSSTRPIHGGLPHDLLRHTVIALARGQRLDDPGNEGEATVQVLRGRVRMTTCEDTTEASTGQLLIVSDTRHTVTALEDAVLLHTVAKATGEVSRTREHRAPAVGYRRHRSRRRSAAVSPT